MSLHSATKQHLPLSGQAVHDGIDTLIRHTCMHWHSLCITHNAHVLHMEPPSISCVACMQMALSTDNTEEHTPLQQHFFFPCCLFHSSLRCSVKPTATKLPVWEEPVGFVLSWVWRHVDPNRPWRRAVQGAVGLASVLRTIALFLISSKNARARWAAEEKSRIKWRLSKCHIERNRSGMRDENTERDSVWHF